MLVGMVHESFSVLFPELLCKLFPRKRPVKWCSQTSKPLYLDLEVDQYISSLKWRSLSCGWGLRALHKGIFVVVRREGTTSAFYLYFYFLNSNSSCRFSDLNGNQSGHNNILFMEYWKTNSSKKIAVSERKQDLKGTFYWALRRTPKTLSKSNVTLNSFFFELV